MADQEDILKFEKVIFEEAATFLKHDNQMAAHMTQIVGALANYLQQNPDKVMELFQSGELSKSGIVVGNIQERGFDLSNLLEKIVDFFLGDKDFIFKLIVLFKCGCDHLPKDWDK